jgi:hypothetical protein
MGLERDLHISAAPTATTGLIGFVFDIREVQK